MKVIVLVQSTDRKNEIKPGKLKTIAKINTR
jgi:hypothetical protein